MDLKQRIYLLERDETILTMEGASEARYLDGLAVLLEFPHHAIGAAYLFGYVAEMLLKAAIGRVLNLNPAAPLRGQLGVGGPDLHDLGVLFRRVVTIRATSGNGIAGAMELAFLQRIDAIAINWSVDFRYKSTGVPEGEVVTMHEYVDWLRRHREYLWR